MRLLFIDTTTCTCRKVKQECIPAECVPPIAVAICWGGVCLSACWDIHIPKVWAWRPTPSQTPQPPPWVWAWRLPSQTPTTWMWAWRPEMHAGIPPPPAYGQNDRHV